MALTEENEPVPAFTIGAEGEGRQGVGLGIETSALLRRMANDQQAFAGRYEQKALSAGQRLEILRLGQPSGQRIGVTINLELAFP
jgi:hypothetical protein